MPATCSPGAGATGRHPAGRFRRPAQQRGLFALSLRLERGGAARRGGGPANATRWSAVGTRGFNFFDAASSALRRIVLRGGTAGPHAVTVMRHGSGLPDLGLPLPGPQFPLVVQLSNSATGACWESRYDTPANILRNDAHALRAR